MTIGTTKRRYTDVHVDSHHHQTPTEEFRIAEKSDVPTLTQMISDGQRSHKKIKRASQESLKEWFAQSERLNIAKSHYKLKGARFIDFARRIGLDKTSAFDLVKLHKHRAAITSRCLDEAETAAQHGEQFQYPGWRSALEWFEPKQKRGWSKGLETAQDRETPDWLYEKFNREFHFTCDAAATVKNRKHKNYFTKQQNALDQEWRGVIWLNPPWAEIGPFIKKAYEAAQADATVVCLVPLWTTEKWFLEYAVHGHIRILSDRVAFVGYDQKAPQCLCAIVFTKGSRRRADGSLHITIVEIKAPGKTKYADETATLMSSGLTVS
jgi:phage N-6-adenine-methyltransferase